LNHSPQQSLPGSKVGIVAVIHQGLEPGATKQRLEINTTTTEPRNGDSLLAGPGTLLDFCHKGLKPRSKGAKFDIEQCSLRGLVQVLYGLGEEALRRLSSKKAKVSRAGRNSPSQIGSSGKFR